MIARLRGTAVASTPEGLLLDVNGVGYLVAATPSGLRQAAAGGEVTVETYLHVREDALQLYGFADRAERELFLQLLTVNGIGPSLSLRPLSAPSNAIDEKNTALTLSDVLTRGWFPQPTPW